MYFFVLQKLVVVPLNVIRTLQTVLCFSRDGVHLKKHNETCRPDSLTIDTSFGPPLFSLDSNFKVMSNENREGSKLISIEP